MLDLLAQTGLNAVYAASYISLIAVGLVLIFGVMGVVNFAHGELYMAGRLCGRAALHRFPDPVLSGHRGGHDLCRLPGVGDGAGAVPAAQGQSSGRAGGLDRVSDDLAIAGGDGLWRADGAYPAGDPARDRVFRTRAPAAVAALRDRRGGGAALGALDFPQENPLRLGLARGGTGPRGGGPAGHLDQPDRGSRCSSARRWPGSRGR